MKPNKTDRLFALKALEKRIAEERKTLEDECFREMGAQYAEDGTTQRRSPFFGKDAGTLTYIPQKECQNVDYALCDGDAFDAWLLEDAAASATYARSHAEDFGRWWFDETGEVPEGISRVSYTTLTAPSKRLAVKEQAVLERLGGNLFEEANRFLLEAGEDE